MSGSASVPLAIAAYVVTNETAKAGFAATSLVCFLYAAFRMWSAERTKLVASENRNRSLEENRPKLEFIFDERDPRCVQDEHYWYEGNPLRSRRWFVGIRNASFLKSADGLTVLARESWFVSCTIAVAHRKFDRSEEKRPVVFTKETLEPQAVEFFELLGLGPKASEMQGDVFHREHDFVIEARARDAVTMLVTLRYHPTDPPTITVAEVTPP
jgi:hypothetical protein